VFVIPELVKGMYSVGEKRILYQCRRKKRKKCVTGSIVLSVFVLLSIFRYSDQQCWPFIHMTIGIFKEWLVKYFFVHKIVFKPFLYFNILSIIWQLTVKWRHLFSCEVKTRPIYGMETEYIIRKWLVLKFHGSGHLPNHTTSK
jgi:hypothetical protein